jgi:endonuclease/exonuclease/phosphatase family metal-dependent hydrolase
LKRFIINILFRVNILVTALLLLAYLAVYINPHHFWPIAFLGLAYPFLLILNLLFVFIWAIRLKVQVFLSLIAILAGWVFIARYAQFELPFVKKEEPHKVENSFKVLSFNVRLFNRYNWLKDKKAFQEIFSFIEKESPDIICFQEFFTKDKISEAEIKKKLAGTSYCYIKYTSQRPNSNFGIATFSKYPIVNGGCLLFEKTYNLCIYTDIKIGEDTVRVYNNHLQSIRFLKRHYELVDSLKFPYSQKQFHGIWDITTRLKLAFKLRAMQAEIVAVHLKRSPHPVIVCGDFNDTPVSYTYQTIRHNLRDAFEEAGSGLGHTYLGRFPSYRIDYILFDNSFGAANYRSPKLELSDHYPVICRMYKK